MGDLRLGRRALQSTPGLLEQLREKGAGTNAAQFRMGVKLRHPERYDDHGQLKVVAGKKPAEGQKTDGEKKPESKKPAAKKSTKGEGK